MRGVVDPQELDPSEETICEGGKTLGNSLPSSRTFDGVGMSEEPSSSAESAANGSSGEHKKTLKETILYYYEDEKKRIKEKGIGGALQEHRA
eukprot:763456-Hanusia_phi.AAC.10